MSLLYIIAGINHFINQGMYVDIMPLWLSQHLLLVNISGACEIIFGILLLPLYTRRFAAWCIILLLIAVFPANIQMTINYYHEHNPYLWLTILRMPLQFVLIRWAWKFAKKPFKKSGDYILQ
ncbi:MAG: DoxX family protein [Parafilimonas sp.]